MNDKINGVTKNVVATLDNGTGDFGVRLSIGDDLSSNEEYYISLSPGAALQLAEQLVKVAYQALGYTVESVGHLAVFY